jgi:glucan 1,3-beta-glucosidase
MLFARAAALSAFILGAVCEELKIPQVEAIVKKTLERLDDYVHFEGNHSDIATVSKRQAAPYWYESIAHQGISAFGPGGYTVYRNVKSYGAKGDLPSQFRQWRIKHTNGYR